MKQWKSFAYFSLALGMLIYAVPQLDMGRGYSPPTLFGVVWIGFAMLVIASHLHHILGVDEETVRERAWPSRQGKWMRPRSIDGKLTALR
jgi:hypothetical protein